MPVNRLRPAAVRDARHIFPAFSLLCLASLLAPPGAAATDDWLPVAPEDLAMKAIPAVPGAHAVVLYSETRQDLETWTESFYVRIKIFDEAGRKYAEAQPEYRSDLYSVEDVRARTIHPDGSIVEFSGQPILGRKPNINGDRFVAAFTCPAATAGSIVEYRYRVQYHSERAQVNRLPGPGLLNLGQWITESRHLAWPIRGELFVLRARFIVHPAETSLPGFPVVGGVRPGYPHYRIGNLPPNTAILSEKLGTLVCEVTGVPAAPQEPFPPPQSEREGHIEMYFTEHKRETPGEFWGRYAGLEHARQAEQLKSQKLARHIVEETAQNGDSPWVTLRKLYACAQQIRNRAFNYAPQANGGKNEPLLLNSTAEETLKRGDGGSTDINLAFIALARAAGFDAQLVRLAPRNLRRFDLNFFDTGQLAGAAVWVRVGDKELLLDPGTPFCEFGMLPWPKAGAGGFRIAKDDILSLTTPRLISTDSRLERTADLQLSADGWLRGSMRAEFYGEEALQLRIEVLGMEDGERGKTLTRRIESWLPAGSRIESLAVSGADSGQDPLRANFRVFIPAAAGAAGAFLLPLTASVAGEANPFESADRIHAVAFPFPYREMDEITIELPAGVELEQLPPLREARLKLPGQIVSPPENGEATGWRRRKPGDVDVAIYQNLRKKSEHAITVSRTLLVGVTEVPVGQYPRLREFFQQVQAGDTETAEVRARSARPD